MSRSYKHSPFTGHSTSESEKKDKQRAHHAVRVHFRTGLKGASNLEEFMFEERNVAHSESFTFAKDGKQHVPLRVRHEGRATRVLSAPAWARTDRAAHKILAK